MSSREEKKNKKKEGEEDKGDCEKVREYMKIINNRENGRKKGRKEIINERKIRKQKKHGKNKVKIHTKQEKTNQETEKSKQTIKMETR